MATPFNHQKYSLRVFGSTDGSLGKYAEAKMAEESLSSSPSGVQPSTTASQIPPLSTDQPRNVNTTANSPAVPQAQAQAAAIDYPESFASTDVTANVPAFDAMPPNANAAAPLHTNANGANTCSTVFEQPATISNEILTPIDPITAGNSSNERDNVPLYYLPRKSFSNLSDEGFTLLCRLCMLGKNPNAKGQHTCFYSNFKGIKELGLTENQMKGAMRRLRQLNLILSDSQGRSRFITLNWELIKKCTLADQSTPPTSMPADCANDLTYTTSFITSLPSGADAVTPNTDMKATPDKTTTSVATDKSLMQWELSGPLFYRIDRTELNLDQALLVTLTTPSVPKPLSHDWFWLLSTQMAGSKALQVPLSSFLARSGINTTEASLPSLVDCVELLLASSPVASVATNDSASAQSLSPENAVAVVNQPNKEQTNVAAPNNNNAGQMQSPAQESSSSSSSTSVAVPQTTTTTTTTLPASSTGGYGYDL